MARVDDGRVSDLRMVTLGLGGVAIWPDNDDFCPSVSPGQIHKSNAITMMNAKPDNNSHFILGLNSCCIEVRNMVFTYRDVQ